MNVLWFWCLLAEWCLFGVRRNSMWECQFGQFSLSRVLSRFSGIWGLALISAYLDSKFGALVFFGEFVFECF